MMHGAQIAIIMENTLGAMTLRSLLSDMAPSINVVIYNSVEEYERIAPEHVAHWFVSASAVFHNPEFFRPIMRRTIVFTDGTASSFALSGFRTIDTTIPEQQLVRAILAIHDHGHPNADAAIHHAHHASTPVDEKEVLSVREKEVLALMVKGYINKEIADKLNISLATVIFHRNNISEKLHTRSIGRLTIYAVLNNIVTLSDI